MFGCNPRYAWQHLSANILAIDFAADDSLMNWRENALECIGWRWLPIFLRTTKQPQTVMGVPIFW
jgi:hypothetical protein